jgi:succinyl-diaminopimelate desuccinylase
MPQYRMPISCPIVLTGLSDADLGERLAARTLELVDVPSESREEAALAAHVLGVLRAGGVEARDAGDTCVLATATATAGDGPDGGPRVLLGGHLDTVPAQGNRPGHRDGGTVHGLGAADMLGAVAVMLELALLAASDPAASPAARAELCLFGREELPVAESALAPLLAREPSLASADLAVMMEPTANALHAGCLGNVNATWTFHGRSGHSARPWQADNAIEHAARAISALAEAAPPRERAFDGLTFTEVVTVTRIEGGIAQNVVPDRVTCQVNQRYAPGTTAAEAEARLHELCDGPGRELVVTSNAPSAPVHVAHPLVRRLIAAGELPVAPKQAWTPVAELAAAGLPAVNFGPGDPRFAHRRDEQVDVAALVRCFRVLEAFLCT